MIVLLWLLFACGTGQSRPVEDDAALDEAYRFCHEAGLYADDTTDFCELLDELPEDVCPGMRESCAGEVENRVPSSGCQPPAEGPASRELVAGPEPPPDPMQCEMPEDLGGVFSVLRWVIALVVALGVLLFLRLIWFFVGRRRGDNGPAPVIIEESTDEEQAEEEPLPDVPDLPGATLLEQARAALDGGDTGGAAELARGASLRHLGSAGELKLHRATTDREYVSAVSNPQTRDALREVVSAVELHRWGGARLTGERARRALQAAARLLGAGLLLAWVTDAHGQTSWRYSPHGDAALSEILSESGFDVSWRLRPLGELDEGTEVLVLDLTGVAPVEEDWEAIRTWVEAGGVLWLAGSHPTFPELGEVRALEGGLPAALGPDWVATDLAVPVWSEGPRAAYLLCPRPWVEAVGIPEPDPPHWDTDEVLVLTEEERAAVVCAASVEEGLVIGVSDERLLWNGSMVHPNNVRFAGDLMLFARNRFALPLGEPIRVELATTSSVGTSTPQNPVGALANARLLPFVLQLLLFWVLLVLWRGTPFGPLRDPPDSGRHRFRDHALALANRYRRMNASSWAWHVYARYWWGRLGPVGLRSAARRHGRTEEDAEALVASVREAAETPPEKNHRALVAQMEELWEMTRRH